MPGPNILPLQPFIVQDKINYYLPRLRAFITNPQYRKSFIKRHFGKNDAPVVDTKEEFKNTYSEEIQAAPVFVNLSENAYASTGQPVENANSALFNDFVEVINPSVFTAQHWRSLPSDYKLFDRKNVPLQDISLFQGVENGTYKIAPLEHFNDTTTLIPVRTAKHPGIVKFEGTPNYKDEALAYQRKENALKNEVAKARTERDNAMDSLQTILYKPTLLEIKNILSKQGVDTTNIHDNPSLQLYKQLENNLSDQTVDSLRTLYNLVKSFPRKKDTPVKSPMLDSLSNNFWIANQKYRDWLAKNPYPQPSRIIYEDGSSSWTIPANNVLGKFTLGNSKGGYFINHPTILTSQSVRDSLNSFINKSAEPLYLAVQDDASYNGYYLDLNPIPDVVDKYLFQGHTKSPQSTYVVGTTIPQRK